LFNLRHASARNVIEHIFGVLKRRFHILLIAPEYDLDIQAQIPSALCAIHNFIRQYDFEEDVLDLDFPDLDNADPEFEFESFTDREGSTDAGGLLRDQIAKMMWEDYLRVLDDQSIEGLDGFDDENITDSDENDL